MKTYYDRRASEYDDWWLGTGLFAQRDRPGWEDDVAGLVAALAALHPLRTLDVACGTAFLTRHLPGEVTGLDQSPAMAAVARQRVADVVEGDALPLPFADGAVQRIFTSHFYGHLDEDERTAFVREAARVATEELVVVDSALRPEHADLRPPSGGWALQRSEDDRPGAHPCAAAGRRRTTSGTAEAWQERTLDDGSTHRVFKRWFTAEGLAAELGGRAEPFYAGPWFVGVRASASGLAPSHVPAAP